MAELSPAAQVCHLPFFEGLGNLDVIRERTMLSDCNSMTLCRRRDCHCATAPSPSGRCFNRRGERLSAK